MSSIPIKQVVEIDPEVIGTGGNPLSLNAVLVSENALASTSQLTPWQDADSVGAYYGFTSPEYLFADSYFLAFDTSSTTPAELFIAGYANTARSAFVRTKQLNGLTLAQLQAISGTLSVTVDGTTYNAASLNLAAASSFTNAATLIATALATSTHAVVAWDPVTATFSITSTTTGAPSTITTPTGTTAAALGFAGGGVIQQGTVIDTPQSAMTRIAAQSLNWACFALAWAADIPTNTGFAQWSNSQGDDFEFVCWDTDPGYATLNNPAVFGSIALAAEYDGVSVLGFGTIQQAGAICGGIAAIDWDQLEGRTNIAFRTQAGLLPSVTDPTTAAAVLSNGAFYYGAYAARGPGNSFNVFYDGRVPGKWKWLDTFVNQLFMNSQFQLSIFTGLMGVNSAPYNELGETYIRSWMLDPITQAKNNGTIRAGVTLSNAQKTQINAQAGLDISANLFNDGWYLQIGTATTQARGARQSPPINFWYCDGGSIQQITVPSIAVL